MAEPGLAGVPTPVPRTPFVDANEQTILNTNPNRVGLGDFTRNDGELPRSCLSVECLLKIQIAQVPDMDG